MKSNYINTDQRTFLIKFAWTISGGRFIFQEGDDLMNLIKEKGSRGIEYIKEFDPVKGTFKRVSKQSVLDTFSFDTEPYLYLQNHWYFR